LIHSFFPRIFTLKAAAQAVSKCLEIHKSVTLCKCRKTGIQEFLKRADIKTIGLLYGNKQAILQRKPPFHTKRVLAAAR